MKFDGKGFAKSIEEQVKLQILNSELRIANFAKPKIVSVLVGDDPASVLYTSLKQKAAQRVGIDFEVVNIESRISNTELRNTVDKLASRADVTGLMIQLPIPNLQGPTLKEVLLAIPYEKDVDGLRYPESGVVPPVVTAILQVLDEVVVNTKLVMKNSKIVVVGAAGFVGSGVMAELLKNGIYAVGLERGEDMGVIKTGDVVISAVGEEGIIKPEMVKSGAILIDVGAPRGDMAQEVYQKASVSVEVPGGIGPVTIACLMQNVVDIYE